jgi:hypothetical protein
MITDSSLAINARDVKEKNQRWCGYPKGAKSVRLFLLSLENIHVLYIKTLIVSHSQTIKLIEKEQDKWVSTV